MILKRRLYSSNSTSSLMHIEDVFFINLLGVAVFGELESNIKVGNKVFITEDNRKKIFTVSHIIHDFKDRSNWPKSAKKGELVGLVLKEGKTKEFKRGDVVYIK